MAKIELKSLAQFTRTSITGSKLAIVSLIVGFIRVKYVVLFFGKATTGLLAQANQLSALGLQAGSLSMAEGVINRLASEEVRSDPQRRVKLLSTAFTSQFLASILIVLVSCIGIDSISFLVFGPGQGRAKVLCVFLSIPFSVLSIGYLRGILFGYQRYDLYVRASVIATVLGLVAFFPLVYLFGSVGAFWSILAASTLLFLCFTYYSSKLIPLHEIFYLGWDKEEMKRLLHFGTIMVVSGAAMYGSSVIIRRLVIGSMGVDATGIMQVPLAMTAYYAPFLTAPLWGRFYPLACSKGNTPETHNELTSVLVLIAVLDTAMILGLLVLKEAFVKLAYSSVFFEALPLIPIQLAGDYFYFIAFTVCTYFLGVTRLRVYLIGWVSYFSILVALTAVLLPQMFLKAIPVAYLVTNLGFAVAAMQWLFRNCTAAERNRILLILVGCLLVILLEIGLTVGMPQFYWRLPVPIGVLLIGAFFAHRRRAVWWQPLAQSA